MTESLKDRIATIEQELDRALPFRLSRDEITRLAGEPLPAVSLSQLEQVVRPGRELLSRGGKRWRPLLLLLSAEMCGGDGRALSLTPLVEIAHNGSLIVDDIEDRARQRRGATAIHVRYGVDLALNSGNLLYFLPTVVIEASSLPDGEKLQVYRYFLEDLRRLHFGQGLDILWHRNHDHLPGEEEYLQMCRLKTGSLSRMAARIGCLAGGGGPERAEHLGSIAENFGAAFQIIDDVKNLSTGVPGKQRGDDVVEGKKSLPFILFLKRNSKQKARLKRLFEAAAGRDPDEVSDVIEEVIALLEPSGCLQEAEGRALSIYEQAKRSLLELFPPSSAREELLGLTDALIHS